MWWFRLQYSVASYVAGIVIILVAFLVWDLCCIVMGCDGCITGLHSELLRDVMDPVALLGCILLLRAVMDPVALLGCVLCSIAMGCDGCITGLRPKLLSDAMTQVASCVPYECDGSSCRAGCSLSHNAYIGTAAPMSDLSGVVLDDSWTETFFRINYTRSETVGFLMNCQRCSCFQSLSFFDLEHEGMACLENSFCLLSLWMLRTWSVSYQ